MKKRIPVAVIIIAAIVLIWTALITNRVQRACVDIGAVGPGELKKISLSVSEITHRDNIKTTMVECHAGAGGMLLLAGINVVLLAGMLLMYVNRKETPNKSDVCDA